ncbi:MAG: NAD(P)-dependent oxidoreductase [Ketobacteraceae bacterium]|nr:NAD(P)-dependent oxidoreductase [Ketobacteraceae bacterium]
MANLANKTLFITGGSRGIGKAIALRAAADGANVVIAAKTAEPHPRLEGTIYTAGAEIEAAGGRALPVVMDVREEEQVEHAVNLAVERFGGIDILINNASAIQLTGTEATPMKRFDLMHQINYRGTFLTSQKCIPHLRESENPHVLNLSPPLNMDPKWFGLHLPYTMAKYGMSFCVLGMAEEYKRAGIAFNALWPKTTIATAAIQNQIGGDQMVNASRKPDIMADAAHYILCQPANECTGNFFVDETVLREAGVTDFSGYRVNPELDDSQLLQDLFL